MVTMEGPFRLFLKNFKNSNFGAGGGDHFLEIGGNSQSRAFAG